MKLEFLFQVWPYIAVAVFGGAFVARYALSYREGSGFAEHLDRARELFGGGIVWVASLVLLLILHAAALLIPERVIAWNSVPARLYIQEVTGFLAGVLVLIGWLRVMWRHFTKSKGSVLGEVADALFLAVVLVSLASGLVMAGAFRWASSWGAATLTPYVHSLGDGGPRLDYLATLPFAVKLHLASAFTALAILPFSSVAPFLIVLLHRLFGLLGRPLGAGSRVAEGWFRKLNPAVWIWPEED
jgi:nitrate reductase gamma subunit